MVGDYKKHFCWLFLLIFCTEHCWAGHGRRRGGWGWGHRNNYHNRGSGWAPGGWVGGWSPNQGGLHSNPGTITTIYVRPKPSSGWISGNHNNANGHYTNAALNSKDNKDDILIHQSENHKDLDKTPGVISENAVASAVKPNSNANSGHKSPEFDEILVDEVRPEDIIIPRARFRRSLKNSEESRVSMGTNGQDPFWRTYEKVTDELSQ